MAVNRAGWVLLGAAVIVVAGMLLVRAYEPESHPVRGRVVDQDTEAGIAGAIVVAEYFGRESNLVHKHCDRVESTVSDANGYYELPTDPRTDLPILSAYAPGYFRGNGLRRAAALDPENHPKQWQIVKDTWNDENTLAKTIAVEPKIYSSQREAQWASGEFRDVFLRRSRVDRLGRLQELRLMSGPAYCESGASTSTGAIPLLEAILNAELNSEAPEQDIRMTREAIATAKEKNERWKSRLPH
jgi:hypothetical protein